MSEKEALLPIKRNVCQCSLYRCANAQYHQTVCAISHLT